MNFLVITVSLLLATALADQLSLTEAADCSEIKTSPNSGVVEINYLVNGSPQDFSDFAFLLFEKCDTRNLYYSINVKSDYNMRKFMWINNDGDTLTIKTNDRELAQRYPEGGLEF